MTFNHLNTPHIGYATLNTEQQPYWDFMRNGGEPQERMEQNGLGMGKMSSDGGPSQYYDFPKDCNTLNDLIEFKKMSFAHGNIFKAAYRLGQKDGISLEYDLKKIKYYADRMLAQIEEGKL